MSEVSKAMQRNFACSDDCVFAGFPRDANKIAKVMVQYDKCKDRILKYISSLISCSALNKEDIISSRCDGENPLEAIDI